MRQSIALSDIATTAGLVGGPFGSSLVGADYRGSGIPVIRGSNMGGRDLSGEFVFVSPEKFERDLARNSATPGDLVFTQRGTLGQISRVPRGAHPVYVVSQSQMRLTVDPSKANSDYVYYACTTPAFHHQIDVSAIRTGVPHINLGILGRLKVPLPPIGEQQAIAEVLGALDDKIAANAELEVASEELIAALYMAACEGGAVLQPLMEALDVKFGEPFKGDQFVARGTGRPLLRIRDIKQRSCDTWTTEVRERETLVRPGQVVAGMDAEFRPRFWLGEPSLLNQRVCLVQSSAFGSAFAREMAAPAMAQIEGEKSGTTVIHMNKADLQRVLVNVPVSEHGLHHAAAANAVLDRLVAAAQESRTLADVRDTLLPALMDGTIRVKDAVAAAEEAL